MTSDDSPKTVPLRGTFTAEEVTRITSWLPKYMQIKCTPGRKLTGFWEPMLAEFFLYHLLPLLNPEEVAAGVDQGDRAGGNKREWYRRLASLHYFLPTSLTAIIENT